MTSPSPTGTERTTLDTYRKKAITVKAVQWKGSYNRMKFPMWFNNAWSDYGVSSPGRMWISAIGLCIYTLEGVMGVKVGDWVIQGVEGELYPCKPNIFEATYEKASPTPPAAAQELSSCPSCGYRLRAINGEPEDVGSVSPALTTTG